MFPSFAHYACLLSVDVGHECDHLVLSTPSAENLTQSHLSVMLLCVCAMRARMKLWHRVRRGNMRYREHHHQSQREDLVGVITDTEIKSIYQVQGKKVEKLVICFQDGVKRQGS